MRFQGAAAIVGTALASGAAVWVATLTATGDAAHIIPLFDAPPVEHADGTPVAPIAALLQGRELRCSPGDHAIEHWLEVDGLETGGWVHADALGILGAPLDPDADGYLGFRFAPDARGPYNTRCCAGRGTGSEREERCGDTQLIYLTEPRASMLVPLALWLLVWAAPARTTKGRNA